MNKKLLLLSALILQGALTIESSSAAEPDFKKELAALAALTKANKCEKMMNYPLHLLVAPTRYNLDPQKALQRLKTFIDLGFDVDDQNKAGETPLHNATFYNNVPAIKLLLGSGADANIQSNRGSKPINIAENRSKEALKILAPYTNFVTLKRNKRTRRTTKANSSSGGVTAAGTPENAIDQDEMADCLIRLFKMPTPAKLKEKIAAQQIQNLLEALNDAAK
jgi:ankyrin repeat protein